MQYCFQLSWLPWCVWMQGEQHAMLFLVVVVTIGESFSNIQVKSNQIEYIRKQVLKENLPLISDNHKKLQIPRFHRSR